MCAFVVYTYIQKKAIVSACEFMILTHLLHDGTLWDRTEGDILVRDVPEHRAQLTGHSLRLRSLRDARIQ